jgi:hypothetical protein
MSEQGSVLAYAVTEGSETGSRMTYAAQDWIQCSGVLQCSRVDKIQELRLKVQVPTDTV